MNTLYGQSIFLSHPVHIQFIWQWLNYQNKQTQGQRNNRGPSEDASGADLLACHEAKDLLWNLQWEWTHHIKCNYVCCMYIVDCFQLEFCGMFLYLQISSIRSLFLCFIVLKMSCSSSQTVIARVLWDYERNICAFCFSAFSEICVWSEVRREDSEWQAETETKWVGKMKVRQTKKQKIDGEINNNEMWQCKRNPYERGEHKQPNKDYSAEICHRLHDWMTYFTCNADHWDVLHKISPQYQRLGWWTSG